VWPLVGKQHRKASKPNKSTLVELYTEARLKNQLIWSLLINNLCRKKTMPQALKRDKSLHLKAYEKKIPNVTVELIIVRLNRYSGLALPKARLN